MRVTLSSALGLLSPALCCLLMCSPSAGAASPGRLGPDAAWKLFGLACDHPWLCALRGDAAMAPLTPSCRAAGCLPAHWDQGHPGSTQGVLVGGLFALPSKEKLLETLNS